MALETEAGNFTVAVEVDIYDAESPSEAALAIVRKLEGYDVRIVRINREYVPIQNAGAA